MNIVKRVGRAVKRRVFGEPKRTLTIENFYLDYLRYATPGMCAPGNIYVLDQVIRDLDSPLPILEIGSWCGQSANIITYLLAKHGKPNEFFTCDGWRFENPDHAEFLGESTTTFDEYYDFVKATYVRNTQFFSKGRLPNSVHLVSDDFFSAWKAKQTVTDVFGREIALGGEFAFCFIDGDHAYPAVRKDFVNCDAHLPPGGQILFDDSAEHGGWDGVRQAVDEVKATGGYDEVMSNPNVLLRKRGTPVA